MARLSLKTRREIERISSSLPAMTERQVKEARRCVGTAWIGKKVGWCDVCGEDFEHQLWDSKKKSIRCPKCGARVDLKKSPRKIVSNNSYYFSVVDVVEGWQIIRTWLCNREAKKMSVDFKAREVFQRFIRKDMSPIIIGYGVFGASYYCDLWNFESDWKIRREDAQHRIGGWVATRPRLLPELKMRGLTRLSDNCSPANQIQTVLNLWEAEVLLKAGAKEMYDYFIANASTMRNYWPSIRVALRHHYKVKDVSLWIDLLRMLNAERKDLRNPHYVCPADVKAEHDRWLEIRRRRAQAERERWEAEERKRMAEMMDDTSHYTAEYRERMGKLLGVIVKVGDIELRPLQTIREFYEEGEAMNHCVFSNGYYKRDNCLIIGARINGERTETIELNTNDWQVMQCRGKHNQSSARHDDIMEAINNNINKYRRMAL